MPVYHMQHKKYGIDLVVEAKSDTAARLHLMREATSRVIGAKEIAALVMDGIEVERASAEQEAQQAAELR